MRPSYRFRRIVAVFIMVCIIGVGVISVAGPSDTPVAPVKTEESQPNTDVAFARDVLETLPIKGRAPKTDYSRDQFGGGWAVRQGCDMRNVILYRDLIDPIVDDLCQVKSGTLNDPYTGMNITFSRGAETSDDVQIDHVVALSDAWQKGAQQLTLAERIELANDPLELLAVDGPTNQKKSDGDAATWLPPYKPFRCQYVARQIAVKQKYSLWVTEAEYSAMRNVLQTCLDQRLPAQ